MGGGGQGGGANSQQAHDVVMTSMRRNDVASTSFRRHVPTRFLTNQCQIITFLILKSDIIENSRIELRGIVLPLPSNRIKVIFIIILPFYLIHLCFFLFHIEIEGKGGWIIGGGGGGGQRVCWPPLSNDLGGLPSPPPGPPLPTPMHLVVSKGPGALSVCKILSCGIAANFSLS